MVRNSIFATVFAASALFLTACGTGWSSGTVTANLAQSDLNAPQTKESHYTTCLGIKRQLVYYATDNNIGNSAAAQQQRNRLKKLFVTLECNKLGFS